MHIGLIGYGAIGAALHRALRETSQPKTFFESSARQAAPEFPQNANVVAAVALAGIGFDRTAVRLVVNPAGGGSRHRIEARGVFGQSSATIFARTLPENPKMRAICNLADPVVV